MRTAMRNFRSTGLVFVAALALTLGGCSADLADVPVPGGVSGPTYEVSMKVKSALNLPVQAPVKLDGRRVGEVTQIRAVDFVAHVTLKIQDDVKLTTDARAEVRLSAPVGEAFVALQQGKNAAGQLSDGDVIELDATSTAPDSTDLLTGLSTVVTGGAYADLEVVIGELLAALDGRAGDVKKLLSELNELVTTMDDNTAEIDAALNGLDRLSQRLADDSDKIAAVATDLAPAVETLSNRQDDLITLLRSTSKLSSTATTTIDRVGDDLVGQLRSAEKILAAIKAERKKIRPILTGISAFGGELDGATPGDYAMFGLTMQAIPNTSGVLQKVDPFDIDLPAGDRELADPTAFVFQRRLERLLDPKVAGD